MRFKKLLLVMLIIVVSMFALMMTASYAWYAYENGSTTFEAVTAKDLVRINYQTGEYIEDYTAVPVKDEDIDKYAKKNDFNIQVKDKNSKNEVMISVKLADIEIDNELKVDAFKIELFYQGSIVKTVTGSSITDGNDLLVGSALLDNEIENQFEIRVYLLDDDTDQTNLMNKRFSCKIKIDVLSRLEDITIVDYSNADIFISDITIDGKISKGLPTEGYYSMTSTCTKGSTLSWEPLSKTITYEAGSKLADACSLTFTSSDDYPLLNTMPVGSYVAYVGKGGTVGSASVACQKGAAATDENLDDTAETEAPNSCLGQNAREDIDENGNTYGYCYNKYHKYYTTGWRLAYIDSNSKPVIVSAGSPECNTRESIVGNTAYIKKANTLAMKYCNSDYVDGNCSCLDNDGDGYCDCTDSDEDGLCDEIENNTVDVWAISDIDFYNITEAISGVGKRLTEYSSGLGDSGGTLTTLYCYGKSSFEECGYNNDLIDNGGYYWFAARYSSSSTDGFDWYPIYRYVINGSSTNAYGLRPVISLKSTVVVTGGEGTLDNPYTIGIESGS